MSLTRLLLPFALTFCHAALSEPFNGFDLSNSLIDKKHIAQGGPPRDGIPSISAPKYVTAQDASFMRPDDVVLGIKIENATFAYPRHILNWHEIVNDKQAGIPFFISYCPLCGSGMAFSAKVADASFSFGVSGLLYNSDLIFYDHQTESLWSQLERRAISGPMVGSKLTQLTLEHTSWSAWTKKNPKTKVLSDQQGFKRNYRHDPYTGYETSSQLFFKTLREAPQEFHSKEKVLGLVIGDQARAYPFSELRKQGLARFDDHLGDIRYRVLWDADANSATIQLIDSDKSIDAEESIKPKELGDADTLTPTVAFWFAWYNFHPNTEIFRARQREQ